MANADTTWKTDRALFLRERPNDLEALQPFKPEIPSLHAYRIITVRWNRERCLHCGQDIHPQHEAAINIDTTDVLCQTCAKTRIEELLAPPKAKKPAKAKTQPVPPPPTPAELEEQSYASWLDTLQPPTDWPLEPPDGDLS